jgi:hypothetical protein
MMPKKLKPLFFFFFSTLTWVQPGGKLYCLASGEKEEKESSMLFVCLFVCLFVNQNVELKLSAMAQK